MDLKRGLGLRVQDLRIQMYVGFKIYGFRVGFSGTRRDSMNRRKGIEGSTFGFR